MKAILLSLVLIGSAQAVELDPPANFAPGVPWCGGIKIQTYATGYTDAELITGEINSSSSCSSGGRGTKPRRYSAWQSVLWDLNGNVVTLLPYDGLVPDPTLTETLNGYTISTKLVSVQAGNTSGSWPVYRGMVTAP